MVVVDIIFDFVNEYGKNNFLNKEIGISNCNLLYFIYILKKNINKI
ncbi:conserved hypothetical protein (plasmid) [Borreliella finlandensis]|uniref:Uncharacterized protein n=1 Tax=Borreliella finlandensis TaxID=498741 RepID=A0A806C7F4_9SPIR|nr:conserved hypothetical protein [Borreliella finlandensis]